MDRVGCSMSTQVPAEGSPRKDAPAPAGPASPRETILVVEDETHIRTWIVGILKNQGYKVLAASDGMEGLQVSNNYANTIDLLICDFRMPRMTGGELIRRVTPTRAGMKVICLSAAGAESVEGFRSVTLLAKPFTLRGFLGTVQDVLAKPGEKPPTPG
jgi:two-component system cell cycle sensor histidine kinase/response regulator CckA